MVSYYYQRSNGRSPSGLLFLGFLLLATFIVGCQGKAHGFSKKPVVDTGNSLPAHPMARGRFAMPSSKTLLTSLRGGAGDDILETSKELLSKDFLAKFYVVTRIPNGLIFTFFTGTGMKLFHQYAVETPSSPANRAAKFAGVSMLADGVLVFLALKNGLNGDNLNKFLGLSLVPFAGLLLAQEAVDTTKSSGHRQKMLLTGVGLGACALSLVTGAGLPTDIAVIAPALLVGTFNLACLFFPETMIQHMEWTPNTKDHKFRFLIRAVATHSSLWLAVFLALWSGKDLYQAIGCATAACTVLGTIVCMIIADLRLSGAPISPMIPFVSIYAYMTYRLLLQS